MAKNCPLKKVDDRWKKLESQVGYQLANITYVQYGYDYPDLVSTTAIKRAIGFQSKTENYAGIAKRLKLYNKKNGTSHHFLKKLLYGNTWELTLKINYLPVNVEKQRVLRASQGEETMFQANYPNTIKEAVTAYGNEFFASPDYNSKIYYAGSKESDAGYFNEEGDFLPPLETIDFILPTASSEIKDSEIVRQKMIDAEIIKVTENLKNVKTVEEQKELSKRLHFLEEAYEKSLARVAETKAISKYEDVLLYGRVQLKELEKLIKNENLSVNQIEYGLRITDLWLKIGDFSTTPDKHIILDEEEFTTDEIRNEFKEIASQFETLNSQFEILNKQVLTSFVKKFTNPNIKEEDIFNATKDLSFLAANTLNVGRAEHPILRSLFTSVNQANIKAQLEANKVWEELDDLSNRVISKSNNYDIFIEKTKSNNPTGNIVSRFSDEYKNIKNEYFYNAFKKRVEGKIVKDPGAITKYYNWTNENTITFDNRLLFPDSVLEEGSMPEYYLYKSSATENQINEHKELLKKNLGEKGFAEYLIKQQKLIDEFKLQREAVWSHLNEQSISFDEMKTFFEEWNKENSPYWSLEMIENKDSRKKVNGSYYKNKGGRYAIQIPKKFIGSKKTDWYNDDFEKIENDKDLLEFYNYTSDLLNQMRYLLPESKKKMMREGVIPSVEKQIIELFKEKRFAMGISPFMDKIKSLQTTTDSSSTLSSDINPNTGKINKEIQLKYIQDTDAKVRQLLKVRLIAYKNKTGVVADNETKKKLKEEVRAEILSKNSFDLVKVLKAYSLDVIAHKHKSIIESHVNLLQASFQNLEELQTNKEGKTLKKSNQKEITQKGLANANKALQYFLDTDFWGTGGRKVEGVTKKKLYKKEEKERKKEVETLLETVEDENERKILTDELNSLGNFRTVSGVGDSLLKYFTINQLGYNIPAGIVNTGFGVIANLTEASGGLHFTTKDMREAYILTLNSVGKNLSFDKWEGVNNNGVKIRSLMDKYNLMQTSNKELFKPTQSSKLSSRFGFFSIQEKTEYVNYAPLMIATLKNFKAKDSQGVEVSYWEALDSKGNLKPSYTTDVDEVKAIQKIKRLIETTHGDYNNPLMAKATLTGRMVSQFRTWMFEGFANRFESEKQDDLLQYGIKEPFVKKGRYRSYTKGQLVTTGAVAGTALFPGVGTALGAGLGYLAGNFSTVDSDSTIQGEMFFTLKQLGRKLLFKSTKFEDKFNAIDAANMRKNMTELYVFLSLVGAVLLLKLAIDDEEKEKNLIANFLLNTTTRLQTDVSFYTNPIEAEKLIKSALPIMRIVQDSKKVIEDVKNLFDEDAKNDTFQSGTFEDYNKLGIHVGQMIPGVNAGIKVTKNVSKIFE